MKSKTTIEVNGKRYDAITGEMLGATSAPVVHTGQNIDGFFRARTIAPKQLPVAEKITILAAPAPRPHPSPQKSPYRGTNHARTHVPQAAQTVTVREPRGVHHVEKVVVHRTPSAPNHARAHTPQSSQILMRASVQRPDPSFHKQAGTKASLQHSVPSLIVSKASVGTIDTGRLIRAQHTSRHPQVLHHATSSPMGVQPNLVALTVQPVPVKPQEQVPNTTPAPKRENTTDIFEKALARANNFIDLHSHKLHYHKQARRHLTSMAAGTLALLVIAGFAAYQNTPGLQFRVASIRAGVSTTMPNFKAAGFAYNGVHASGDRLTIGFSRGQGTYQLTQQSTNLSNDDMIASISATDASGTPNYRAVQATNTTIYRFANTNATWVENGTWYTVNGNAPLSDQQVQSLVKNI
ncbi:MAG TPA: hypothetical protein VLE99_02790 [Candidatus Saccharimonadales bacterium]|nr:hypothetical protein [Candidatus Saccharimonadales bacterium]